MLSFDFLLGHLKKTEYKNDIRGQPGSIYSKRESFPDGELDWYLSWQPYTPEWRQMSACSAQVEARLWSSADAAPSPTSDLHSNDRDLRPDTVCSL